MVDRESAGAAAQGPVFLISGTPGAGKSTVARALAQRFPFSVHIPMDDLREWVVSGLANPVPVWTNETTRQFRLARRAAAEMARIYAAAGFTVVIDDVIFPHEARVLFVEALQDFHIHKILLRPSMEAALHRNATRTNKTFDTLALAEVIRSIHASMNAHSFTREGWLVVDNSNVTPDTTVDEILRLTGEGEYQSVS